MKKILRYFGLMTCQEFFDKFRPFRTKHILMHKTLCKALNRNDALKKEVEQLKQANELLRKGNRVLIEKNKKEQMVTRYVVEHSDPSRYIYDPYTQEFNEFEDAKSAYQKLKSSNGKGSQESLELYKKVTLLKVKTEYVLQKK